MMFLENMYRMGRICLAIKEGKIYFYLYNFLLDCLCCALCSGFCFSTIKQLSFSSTFVECFSGLGFVCLFYLFVFKLYFQKSARMGCLRINEINREHWNMILYLLLRNVILIFLYHVMILCKVNMCYTF